MIVVNRGYAFGNSRNVGVISGIIPGLEVIGINPYHVREALVAIPEVDAVIEIRGRSVALNRTHPATRIGWVQEYRYAVLGGQLNHVVNPLEVGRVGSGEVPWRSGEG